MTVASRAKEPFHSGEAGHNPRHDENATPIADIIANCELHEA